MNTATAYAEFIERKSQLTGDGGFEPLWIPDFLYDFQKALVEWSIRKGNSAIFADCGLGKTPIQLVWSENVIRKTNGKVLIIAPLAVSAQTVREAEKFGIDCRASKDGTVHPNITVTNYERLHYFDPDAFSGVVCDESSAIKQFGGKRRKQVIQFMHKTPYRLLCTATAAPNDYIELGTHSEALGIMGQVDMLSTFFRSPDNANYISCKAGDFWNTHNKFMFKAHAELEFWRWVCSWARALRRPSDLGFDDSRFVLPPLEVEQTTVRCNRLLPGELFPVVARSLKEQREERRLTIDARCAAVADKVKDRKHSVVWCHLNEEGDILAGIPGAVQVQGSDSDDFKEETFNAFSQGKIKVLVTKPKIGAFGMNWQHCNHEVFFPSHSFEQYYQGVRRCWRFGQTKPVHIDVVTTEGESGVTANLKRKSEAADKMFQRLVDEMNNAIRKSITTVFGTRMEVPSWL